MTETSEKFAKGTELFTAVYGQQVPLPANAAAHPFQQLMMENLFCDIWGRSAMSIRDRRLILIGVIAVIADSPMLIEIQLRAALEKRELEREQLREIPIILTQYIGYPRTVPVMQTVEKILADTAE